VPVIKGVGGVLVVEVGPVVVPAVVLVNEESEIPTQTS
jgi:hypothetical protein